MAFPNILFRTISKPPFNTKGSELTWVELDNVIADLLDNIIQLQSTGNVTPYDNAATYTPNGSVSQYVSYNGNIYLFISSTPQTGVVPGSGGAGSIWQLSSTGALAHAQNTDTYLAFGTGSQVSAAQLKTILGSLVIITTYSQAQTDSAAGTLRPGYWYLLIDKQVFIRAYDAIHFDRNGYGFFYNCDYQNVGGLFLGVWQASLTPSSGQLCSWDGVQYVNPGGINGVLPPNLDPGNWTALPTTDPSYIQECDNIIYDFDNDVICQRSDKRGNMVGDGNLNTAVNYGAIGAFKWGDDEVCSNKILVGSLNCINAYGRIKENLVDTGAQPYAYYTGATILRNKFSRLAQTTINMLTGDILNSTFEDNVPLVFNDTDAGTYSNLFVSLNYSNLEIVLDITGLTTIDFSVGEMLNKKEAVGIISLASINASETISTLANSSSATSREIKIAPFNFGLTINSTAWKLLNGDASRVLDGTKGDCMFLHVVLDGGVSQFKEKLSCNY